MSLTTMERKNDIVRDTKEQPAAVSDQAILEKGKVVSERAADETLQLIEEYGASVGPLTLEAEKKLKRKIHLHILLLVIVIDLMLYVSFFLFWGWIQVDG